MRRLLVFIALLLALVLLMAASAVPASAGEHIKQVQLVCR
jgi:hypothetical protein